MAAIDNDLLKSSVIITYNLRQDLNPGGDGESEHEAEHESNTFKMHAASPDTKLRSRWM
jgi:hypothetical protein